MMCFVPAFAKQPPHMQFVETEMILLNSIAYNDFLMIFFTKAPAHINFRNN